MKHQEGGKLDENNKMLLIRKSNVIQISRRCLKHYTPFTSRHLICGLRWHDMLAPFILKQITKTFTRSLWMPVLFIWKKLSETCNKLLVKQNYLSIWLFLCQIFEELRKTIFMTKSFLKFLFFDFVCKTYLYSRWPNLHIITTIYNT